MTASITSPEIALMASNSKNSLYAGFTPEQMKQIKLQREQRAALKRGQGS